MRTDPPNRPFNSAMSQQCCEWVAPTQRMPASTRCGDPNSATPWTDELAQHRAPRVALRIVMNHGSAGFFAYMLFAINQLLFARRNGLTAVVDFGECTVNGHDHYASGGRNLYFDRQHGPNMWEYYFEPVSAVRPPAAEVRTLPSRMLWRLHHESKASVYAYYYGRFASKRATGYDARWFQTMRHRAHSVLEQYVRLKPHVQEAVESFWRRELADRRPVLGLHARGTDKEASIGGSIVPPSSYVRHIEQYLRVHSNATIFVATDSPSFLAWFRQRYGARVVARPALRSEANAFRDPAMKDHYRKGLDVLLDALLLSRSDYLIKSSSAVGEFAIYFNPTLHTRSVDVQFEDSEGQTASRTAQLPSYTQADAGAPVASLHSTSQLASCAMNADFMMHALDLLPDPPQSASACTRSGVEEAGRPSRRNLFALLSRLESRSASCGRATTTTLLPAGWFSTLHGVIKPLAHSVRTRAALLTPALSAFTSPSCPSRDLSCFFKRFESGSCGHGVSDRARHLNLHDDAFVRNESFSLHGDAIIPQAFRSRGWFWYSSQLLSWVMRPNLALAADLSEAERYTGLRAALRRGPVLGVHVRHGDACLPRERRRMSRTCYSLEAHLSRVRRYAQAFGIRTVYLATDSEAVLEQAKSSTEFEFLWLPNVTRQRSTPSRIIDRTVKARAERGETHLSEREAWLATLDVMLLAKCHLLVGQMTSTFFRTAISLRAAACDCVMPFASLDSAYCSDYGVRSGKILAGAGVGSTFWC